MKLIKNLMTSHCLKLLAAVALALPLASNAACGLMDKRVSFADGSSACTLHLEQTLTTLGGRVVCQRCQAKSKRTKLQCGAPALKGKTKVCKTHGGRSTGPRTEAGRQRCAEAKSIHGRETRDARAERSLASARLAVLEEVGFALSFMSGTRTRGRRPDRMAEAHPQIEVLMDQIKKISFLQVVTI